MRRRISRVPIALAGIRGLHATTEDRCIPLVMQRGTDRARVNAEVNPEAPALARIRDGCYRLLLTRSAELTVALAAAPLPAWLNARARELWRPLRGLAHVADQEEHALGIGRDLLLLAREHVEDRDDNSPEAEAVLVLLAERLAAVPAVTVRPGALAAPLRDRSGWRDTPTPEAVSRLLRRLGFRSCYPMGLQAPTSMAVANAGVNADVAIAIVKAAAVKEALFADQEVARAVTGFFRARREGPGLALDVQLRPNAVATSALEGRLAEALTATPRLTADRARPLHGHGEYPHRTTHEREHVFLAR